jgi:FkbM family methyltransferase
MNIEEYSYSNFLKKGDVVYDIGAHIGERSVFFHKAGAKKIYGFEPVPFNFEQLKQNVSMYKNIEIFDIALHEKEYECATEFRHCNPLIPALQKDNIKYEILENFINKNNIDLPDFLKFDIEGMESLVLKTCNFLFENKRPVFYVEIHVAGKNDPQSYENCPHWKTPQDGGFNFNDLKSYNYKIMHQDHGILNASIDWNPVPVQHKGLILIPQELL